MLEETGMHIAVSRQLKLDTEVLTVMSSIGLGARKCLKKFPERVNVKQKAGEPYKNCVAWLPTVTCLYQVK